MADAILVQSGIYAIVNKVNGKRYVGSAVNLRARFRKHIWELGRGSHHSVKMQHAWEKYGRDSFDFIVLEVVQSQIDLLPREQFWIDSLQVCGDAGYNMSPTAGSNLGTKRSPETLAKMRESGLKYRASDETREKLRVANTGKKASPEKLAKMSALVKSPETIEKLRIAGTGRKLSPESIEKMRAFNLGLKRSDEARQKMRLAKLGRKLPPETRMRMAEAQRVRRAKEKHEHYQATQCEAFLLDTKS